MISRKLLVSFAVLALCLPAAAHAQSVKKTMDSGGVPYSSKYWQGMPSDNVISLARLPLLTEDQFVLRITDPYPKNGCAEISDYGYMAEYKDMFLDISIEALTVDMRNQPQYAHYQCNQHAQQPAADIVLNRQDIIEHGTQQIRMHNDTGTNYYNIKLTDNSLMIVPDGGDDRAAKLFKPQQIPGRKTALTYWFYPVGTLLLWVPGAKDPKLDEKLDAFAKAKGFTPIETVFTDFETPLTSNTYHYYIDTAGTLQDEGLRDGMPIGAIQVEKTVFGLEKDEIALDNLTVYAKQPGMYD